MASAHNAQLQAIQDQLDGILEDRLTELMTQIKSAQGVARQIARTEEEIDRQQRLKEQLAAQLGPMRTEAEELRAETDALQAEVDALLESISRMKNIREELLAIKGATSLSGRPARS